jgi:hypothetical protein
MRQFGGFGGGGVKKAGLSREGTVVYLGLEHDKNGGKASIR